MLLQQLIIAGKRRHHQGPRGMAATATWALDEPQRLPGWACWLQLILQVMKLTQGFTGDSLALAGGASENVSGKSWPLLTPSCCCCGKIAEAEAAVSVTVASAVYHTKVAHAFSFLHITPSRAYCRL
jgi:hypothetical protein